MKLNSKQFLNQFYVGGDISDKADQAIVGALPKLAKKHARFPTDCGAVCHTLHGELQKHGVDSSIHSGHFVGGQENTGDHYSSREHVWLKVEGHIVDPTAIQFRHTQVDSYKGSFHPEHYVEDD